MDYRDRKIAQDSINKEFGPTYDSTTYLDPEVAAKINKLPTQDRPNAVNKAYQDAGIMARLHRALMNAKDGDIYNNDDN